MTVTKLKEKPILFSTPIQGFESLYEINTNGDVFSYTSKKTIKQVVNNCGYLTVVLCKDGKAKRFLVHRLLAIHFVANPQNAPVVNHKDGNKLNNKLENMEWCSRSENNRHAIALGLTPPPHNKGKPLSDETKRKLSLSLKGRKSPCGMQGKTLSEVSRMKISQSSKGVSRNKGKIAYQYPIQQFSLTDDFIRNWNSAKEASRELGFHNGNLVSCLKGKRHQAGGFKWKYQQ